MSVAMAIELAEEETKTTLGREDFFSRDSIASVRHDVPRTFTPSLCLNSACVEKLVALLGSNLSSSTPALSIKTSRHLYIFSMFRQRSRWMF